VRRSVKGVGKLELSEESRVFSKTAGFGKLEMISPFLGEVPQCQI